MSSLASFTGCMMGGALGDALGYPIEFMSYDQIIKQYGTEGIKEPVLDEKELEEISDDTQMTLFTAEGLLWAEKNRKRNGYSSVAAKCFCSYQRWLHTQAYPLADASYGWMLQDERLEIDSPLLNAQELKHRRAEKTTSLKVLLAAKNQDYGSVEYPINRCKGSGGLSRSAPAGLAFHNNPKRAFEAGCDIAAVTHCHPNAYYSAGFFCAMIAQLLNGKSIEESADEGLDMLERFPASYEVRDAVVRAVEKAKESGRNTGTIKMFGEGTSSEEVLAIAMYCALSYQDDYRQAVRLAANQNGDSAAAASLCGSILGAKHGITGLVPEWIKKLEGKNIILKMASMLYSCYE